MEKAVSSTAPGAINGERVATIHAKTHCSITPALHYSSPTSFLFPHDLFHGCDNFGRLIQNFFCERLERVTVNKLRFETLFFGVGNQVRAGERFGVAGAQNLDLFWGRSRRREHRRGAEFA